MLEPLAGCDVQTPKIPPCRCIFTADVAFAKFYRGLYQEPLDRLYLENVNPATGELISFIPRSNVKDVNLAVEAATNVFPQWRQSSLESRFKILNRIADLIELNLREFALAETNDTGKPITHSENIDITRAATNFRFFATAAMQFASESHESPGKAINYTLRHPIGIVGCISPWNLPLYLFTENSSCVGN